LFYSSAAPETVGDPASFRQWQDFVSEINSHIQGFHGTIGLVIKDLNRGYCYSYNADKKFVSASLIKLPIMAAVFKGFMNGTISLTQTCILKDCFRVYGSGILKNKPSGSVYSVYRLVYTMIAHSDNTAAKMLTELVGLDRMNILFKNVGLRNTIVTARSFDLSDNNYKDDSFTTPRDIADILTDMYEERAFPPYLSHQIFEVLKLSTDRQRLNKYLPKKFQLAHKTGLLRGACHDAGVVFSPHGDYLICVMTDTANNYPRAKEFIATIGKITFNNLQKS
jgi:beta-lactamase class A